MITPKALEHVIFKALVRFDKYKEKQEQERNRQILETQIAMNEIERKSREAMREAMREAR